MVKSKCDASEKGADFSFSTTAAVTVPNFHLFDDFVEFSLKISINKKV
jgi:hypothetical protein